MAIRALVFDLFDTVVDLHMERLPRGQFRGKPIPATADALHGAARTYADVSREHFLEALVGVDGEFLASRYAQGLELPTLERFAALASRLGVEEGGLVRDLTECHMAGLREQVSVPEHHGDVLRALGRRVRLGICSNFSHSETALAILEESGLAACFDAIVVSDVVGFRKPRPEIFEAALDALGVGAEEAVHVGDNLRADVGGAASLGIRTAWITRRIADVEAARGRYEGPAPDLEIGDLAELAPLLASAAEAGV